MILLDFYVITYNLYFLRLHRKKYNEIHSIHNFQNQNKLYRDINAGKFGNDAKTGSWYVGISSVKAAFPKP